MTEKSTLSIDANEWQALAATNLQRMLNTVNQVQRITTDDLPMVKQHLDRTFLIFQAWAASVPPVQTEPVVEHVAHEGNGAEPIKRKRGRPPGSRKRMNPAQVVQ